MLQVEARGIEEEDEEEEEEEESRGGLKLNSQSTYRPTPYLGGGDRLG
jgi:hypothetical protein